jgi:hypothetical protein
MHVAAVWLTGGGQRGVYVLVGRVPEPAAGDDDPWGFVQEIRLFCRIRFLTYSLRPLLLPQAEKLPLFLLSMPLTPLIVDKVCRTTGLHDPHHLACVLLPP